MLRAYTAGLFLLLLPGFGGCASEPALNARDAADASDTGRVLAPANDSERRLLEALPRLAEGREQRVAEAKVVAEAPYASASGKTCRAVHFLSGPRPSETHRLACSDGKSWFFVPDVLGGTAVAE